MEVRFVTLPEGAVVFDAGPLRHFAANGWLGVLGYLTRNRQVYIPDVVGREIGEATSHVTGAKLVLEAEWIKTYSSTDLRYTAVVARYENQLVADGKNRGECGVLAMGEVFGCEIVIDDAVPRAIAESKNLNVTATLPLLCQAVKEKQLTAAMVEHLAEDLLQNEYFLPFAPGEFRSYTMEHGLLDWEDFNPNP
jgi:predicted nucleic acid-binding protein